MAEGKQSFVLYTNYITTFEELDDAEAGRLIKHLFRYVNDKNPEPPDRLTKIAAEPIIQQMKRDLKGWEFSKETKSSGGQLGNLKRWHTDLYEKVSSGAMKLTEGVAIARDRRSIPVQPARLSEPVLEKISDKPKRTVFKPPTFEQVQTHLMERRSPIDAAAFIAFYESKGWMIGKNKMKDWKQTVITWEKRRESTQGYSSVVKPTHANSGDGTNWDAEAARINGK